MRIFISYRRDDSSGHAGRLFDALQARFGRGHVFMDVSAIDAGENFVEAIDRAVRNCDALVAVIGDEWLTCMTGGTRRLDAPDDFVRTEIATALDRGVPVVPVLVEKTSMPSAAELPAALKRLATRHAHELTDARWSYDVARLIDALERLAGPPPAKAGRLWLVAGAALAAMAIAAASYRWSQPDATPATLTPPVTTTEPSMPAVPAADLNGEWAAEVKYSWGVTHPERFTFKVEGAEVLGTASFLRLRRGILDGTLTGNRLAFRTETQEILGDETRDVTHRYRGTITGDEIAFYMQSQGGAAEEPIEFVARRVKTDGGEPAP